MDWTLNVLLQCKMRLLSLAEGLIVLIVIMQCLEEYKVIFSHLSNNRNKQANVTFRIH